MAKLTKKQIKLHEEANKILEKPILSIEEKEFVLNNWRPEAENNVASNGVFFTPPEIAHELHVATGDSTGKVLDLCAGIGRLGFTLLHYGLFREKPLEITAIEKNPKFVEVGKKILPEANWICMDVFIEKNWNDNNLEDEYFDFVISNPPFGHITNSEWRGLYTTADLLCVAIGFDKSKYGGIYILPTGNIPWEYSGKMTYTEKNSLNWNKLKRFYPTINAGCTSIDVSEFKKQWSDVSPNVEIVDITKSE